MFYDLYACIINLQTSGIILLYSYVVHYYVYECKYKVTAKRLSCLTNGRYIFIFLLFQNAHVTMTMIYTGQGKIPLETGSSSKNKSSKLRWLYTAQG